MSFLKPARRARIRRFAAGLVVALLFAEGGVDAATNPPPSEYELKAVFLYQFANFVEWPVDAFTDEHTPFTIGVLGDDPFGTSLDDIVANETVGGRRLVVRRYRTIDQVDACHVLFISASEAGRLAPILAKLKGRSVLTVGDTKDFVAQNGIVGFTTARNRLKLRINLAAADSARLTISSKLLRQADIVRGKRRQG